MLPHILHSTGRAVAVVHNQTHAFRNVLQLQSTGPSSGSGSGWGNGPGPGGSKYGAGSRFYTGYNSAGRAVTQANAVTSQDGQTMQVDEQEEVAPRRTILPTSHRKPRMRSSSVSMGVSGRMERGEKLGVLKTVQLHTRGKHAFAPVETMASAKERLLADPLPVVPSTTTTTTTQPLLVRRNSTSAPLSPLLNATEPPIPPPEIKQQATDQPEQPTPEKKASKQPGPFDRDISHLRYLANTKDVETLPKAVRKILGKREQPSVEVFNTIFWALNKTRAEGTPLGPIIDVYNAMLAKSVLPNVETYEMLIQILTTRDLEIHRAKVALELRMKRQPLLGRSQASLLEDDQARRAQLEEEDNFPSAMSLFEGVLAVGGKNQLQPGTFVRLVNCAANHGDVHAAIHIFAQLESLQIPIPIPVYRHMILAFSNAGQIEQAEEIFSAFIDAGTRNKLARYPSHHAHAGRQAHIMVWNTMMEAYFRAGAPEKAVELVDQILKSEAGNNFTPADTPIATSSMFTTVIDGFLRADDVTSALAWFDKLLGQEKAPQDPYQGISGGVMRPDGLGWFIMLDALASHGMIEDLNRLYKVLKDVHVEDSIRISSTMRLIVYTANVEHLDKGGVDRETAVATLKGILQDLEQARVEGDMHLPWNKLMRMMCSRLVDYGELDYAARAFHDAMVQIYADGNISLADNPILMAQIMGRKTKVFTQRVYEKVYEGAGTLSFLPALLLARLVYQLELRQDLRFSPVLLHAYGLAKNDGTLEYTAFKADEWEVLLTHAAYYELNALDGNPEQLPEIPGFAFSGNVLSMVEDFRSRGAAFEAVSEGTRQQIVSVVDRTLGTEVRQQLFASYGPAYAATSEQYDQLRYRALENAVVKAADLLEPVEEQLLRVEDPPIEDAYLSKAISHLLGSDTIPVQERVLHKAYRMFEDGLKKGKAPAPHLLCRLIEGEGRCKDLDRVRELYTAAQSVLAAQPPESQRFAWAAVENSMVVALAHAGHVDAAHVHRVRILEQGLAPSADAYGILVQLVRDTTDDTSGAIALFQEAVERGVKPNMYLYNNIISKLSKARKADYALELFQQMKASGVRVSSITYGTVIGACARVGDVVSAESLFKEMTRSRNFKPRVPPYNTMMQLHTTTKPNRVSALYYYNEMRKAGVAPSAHTYKLLLDTYGSVEPVELAPMEKVFSDLLKDKSVEVTGAHFASLINAYGCVSKDLNKAISVFESMGTYARAPKPDAVAFEAIINAIVAHKQTDLLPVYINKMVEAGVHMTAYIANFLIKGYANVGDLDKAREIFESLANPPTGVAAPNNHVPHSPDMNSEVPVMDPVYREPSTWEVMVRAELGAGNRDAALSLLERLRERQYPEAVYSRISGILTDFSVPQ